MTTTTARAGLPARRYRRPPWSRDAWGPAINLAGGIPAQLAMGIPVVLFVAIARRAHADVLLLVGVLALLAWLLLGYLVLPALTGILRPARCRPAGVAALDGLIARPLLGPSRAEELQYRVERLAQTRAGVVDAADAERRRLERDLHDGTQQRLVSLAMNLGMARVQATTADDARLAIAEAHEEAKAALSELRDLIRGLHPAVLEDRGLDAALSGVAARMPIPVRLTVDLQRRPTAVIEAVAYFGVSQGPAHIATPAPARPAEGLAPP